MKPLGLLLLLAACSHPAEQVKTFADLYPRSRVFSPSSLAKGEIAIEDANGELGKSVEIGKLQFSEKALILLETDAVAAGFTTTELSEQIGNPAPAKPKCSFTEAYFNERFTVNRCVLSQDTALFASYQKETGASPPTRPLARARLARGLTDQLVFRCLITVPGATSCQNSCWCPACVECTFTSADGLIMAEVPEPGRDADSTSFLPCNAQNQCSN